MSASRSAGEIVRAQLGILLVLAAVSTVTGLVLRSREEALFELPWLLALVPVVNALGGNLGAVLGARLTSSLHLGTLEPRLVRGELTTHLTLTLVGGAAVYGLLALFTFLVGPHTGLFPPLGLGTVAFLVLGSGSILTVGVIGLSLGAAFVAYRRGLDPDDIVIPVVTNTTDLLGVVVLFAVSGVVL